MLVFLDGRPERFHVGATVRDLAGRLPDEDLAAWKRNLAYIADADGYEMGEGGGLTDGVRYSLKYRDKR